MLQSSDRVMLTAGRPIGAGEYVLYWMTGTRRTAFNYAIDRAVAWCDELNLPLVIVEPLTCRPEWSNLRFHQFVLGGMADNEVACAKAGVAYVPYIEPAPGSDRGFFKAVAKHAAVVVGDDSMLPLVSRVGRALIDQSPVRCELVDSMGLLPFRNPDRPFVTAASFRRYLQKELPDEFGCPPAGDVLRRASRHGLAKMPPGLFERYPTLSLSLEAVSDIPLNHDIRADPRPGGRNAGLSRLARFVRSRIQTFGHRGDLMESSHSGLSPYFHFGHLGPHDVLVELGHAVGWAPPTIWPRASGARHGWWGLSEPVEAFLDEVVTWRELAINGAMFIPEYQSFESLPGWARDTLLDHSDDVRPWIYEIEMLESAATHDPLWNAAQMELVEEGRIHSYLRMLWGKKILEWTASPREALDIMIYLNDTYATDGRDPSSYAGILWVLGRYDRPWTERPIFGKIRYMASENTAKKFRVNAYINRYQTGAHTHA